MPTHIKGLLITAIGVLIISPDGLLTRLIQTDHWTMIFWRALFLGFGTWLLVGFTHVNQVAREFRALKGVGIWVVLAYSFGTMSFVTAITHTSVANTLIILSTTPLFSAIIARIFLSEPIQIRTVAAIVLVSVGMFIIANGSASSGGSVFGDFMAMLGSFFMACSFNLVRRFPKLPLFPAISVSGFLTAILVLPFAAPLSISQSDLGYLLIMGIYILPIGSAMLFIGPRYIPAAEVGLILLLESIFGTLWVYLVFDEIPGTSTLIGGAVVLLALLMNGIWALSVARRANH